MAERRSVSVVVFEMHDRSEKCARCTVRGKQRRLNRDAGYPASKARCLDVLMRYQMDSTPRPSVHEAGC
jgi:hypothetical protein